MKITILGNNSALPAFGRHPTSQAVTIGADVILVDCGEGTQLQMQRFGIKWRKVKHIFISHLHGDHYFGLPGLVNSMSLLGRQEPLYLYAPALLEPILQQILSVADTTLSYPLHFVPLPNDGGVLADNFSFTLTCFPVEHRIQCHGLLLETKSRLRRILPRQCEEYEVPIAVYEMLKDGVDYVTPDGRTIANELLTEPGHPAKRYAYCADTIYTQSFLHHIMGADAIYHEATYLEADKEKAEARYHSTAKQAAQLAINAGVGQLLLGHFSSKYKELDAFHTEASELFQAVTVTTEGTTYEI